MNELNHLVQAVRQNLSEEDKRLLRTVHSPPEPERYDVLFDRVLERLRSREASQLQSSSPAS